MNQSVLKEKTEEINRIIESFLPEAGPHTALVTEATAYSVRAGGKRLRPLLMQESYFLFKGDSEDELLHAFMTAIEFIHTYSLVHDDLPAMDNDEFRRGLPTTHAKFGEAFGILAGDALLNLVFEVPLNALAKETDPNRLTAGIKALRVLAEKAGINGMIGGQCLDVYAEKNEGFETREEELFFIFLNKTSALLQASLMVGAILAGAFEEDVKAMEEIGADVGVAFQIRDDILDVTSTTEVLGKPVGSDAKNDKVTWITFKGLEQAEADVKSYSESAIERLRKLEKQNPFLEELIILLINREK